MRSYFFVNPWWLRRFYSKATFSIPTTEGTIYLTFDDGPDPEVTPWVLKHLEEHNAKASFFLIGQRVKDYPDIVEEIIAKGHAIGNHTYSHVNGWKVDNQKYFDEVDQCSKALKAFTTKNLFRPPYGRIRLNQLSNLTSEGYKVIMWSHLSGDFDPALDLDKSLSALTKATSGSVLVFHDSKKASQNLKELLPRVLDHFSTLRYSFKSIT
ncbi:MAG: polysaccharide deacetylase family protein [Marinoscillum sp.]